MAQGIDITQADLNRCMPGEWINDNVIDFYITKLAEKCQVLQIPTPCHIVLIFCLSTRFVSHEATRYLL